MFDRGVLFVGAEGVGIGLLAEAIALDIMREMSGSMPLRVYSATTQDMGETDPMLLRAMKRMQLDSDGLSLKPLALFAFAGAPRIDHVVLLGAKLPAATKLALGDGVDVRQWDIALPSLDTAPPGTRYAAYCKLAEALRTQVGGLLAELGDMGAASHEPIVNTA